MSKKQKGEPTKEEWDLLADFVLKRMIDEGLIENGKLTKKGRKALKEAETPR